MNIVSYGGGTNSTAMLIGMWQKGIKADLILFADTGAERPETYEHVKIFNEWLKSKGMPEIITLHYDESEPHFFEKYLLKLGYLPPPCYGFKSCSDKYKIRVVDRFCNVNVDCKEVWERGEKINKYIGYDAGEERRKDGAAIYDEIDKKYKKFYLLIEWGWYREDCIRVIKEQGLPLPGKSSCFFCPNMKKREIRELYKKHPDLFQRAIEIERNGKAYSEVAKGLGRSWSWEDFIEAEKNQVTMCELFDEDSIMPCGCYDG